MTDIYADGLPEDLYVDIESTIHQHCGHDGQSDEANDWVTDLMAALTPLIVRALVGGRPAAPTREQVQETIHDAYVAEVKPPSFLTVASMWQLTDAVVALLSRSAAGPPDELREAAQALGSAIVKRLPLMHRKAIEAEYEALRAALADGVAAEPKEHGDGD